LNLPVKTGIKPKDSVIMRRRVSGANAEKQPTAYSVRQPLGWRGGLEHFHQRMEGSRKAILTN
jgi:hypothetical protein